MAYLGYRISIDNSTIPNSWISKGTYSASKSPRIAESFTDIAGITHDVPYSTTKAIIEFSLREHSLSEHADFASLFTSRATRTIEYWDDDTSDYLTGTFKVKDFTWNHLTADGNDIQYGATKITLEEY